jgi:sulfur-carrier protein adenylyltransferase/sulfurtransferase
MSTPELTNDEVRRYARHLVLPEFGIENQRKLKGASILLIGAGGLGSPLALYLAAAGIGRIGIVDFDRVDESNLQRQIAHGTSTIGVHKGESAKARIHDLNPNVQVDVYDEAITSENALRLIEPYDVVVDGTDNFPTRYLTNDACVLLGKPNVYGSIFRFDGQATVFAPHLGGPCYRCLYPEPPPPGLVPSCAEGGVLGVLPGLVGVVQATEAIKLITGIGEPLIGRLALYDALSMRFKELKLRPDPQCPMCGPNRSITELIDYEMFCGMPAREVPAEQVQSENDVTPAQVAERLAQEPTPFLLDVREDYEWDICFIPGAVRISVNELADRIGELDPHAETIVYCKGGARSARAAELLRDKGFERVSNMLGGINRWSEDVDPSVPLY